MKALRPVMFLGVLVALILGTATPAAAAAIAFTSDPPASPVTAWQPYPAHTFTATGDTTISLTLASGTLPVGMALATTGSFSGTPTTPGSYTFTVRATGTSSGAFVDQTVTVVVVAPVITITSGSPASPVTAWQEYPTHTFTGAGGTEPYSLSLRSGSLPVGMALSSSRVFSGTPTTPGTHTFTIRLTDAHGFFADQTVTVVVVAPVITITSDTPTSPWYAGQEYPTHTFTAAGGTEPYSLSLRSGSLPVGMALSSSRVFSGTPTTPGTHTFTIRLTDRYGFFADQDVTVVIVTPATTIASTAPPRGVVGTAYSFAFTATGDSNIQFSLADGQVPSGLTLAANGVLSGTPAAAGSFTFTLKAAGAASSATRAVTVLIDPDPSSPPQTPPQTPAPTRPTTGQPVLPVTGSNVLPTALMGVASIAIGSLILIVLQIRQRRSLQAE